MSIAIIALATLVVIREAVEFQSQVGKIVVATELF